MLRTLAEAKIPTPDTSGLTDQLHDPAFWGKVLAGFLCVAFLIGAWKALKAHPWVMLGAAFLIAVGTGLFEFKIG